MESKTNKWLRTDLSDSIVEHSEEFAVEIFIIPNSNGAIFVATSG